MALLLAVGYVFLVGLLVAGFIGAVHGSIKGVTSAEIEQQCMALAEAGIEKAVAEVLVNGAAYGGEEDTPLGKGAFSAKVTPTGENGVYRIASVGKLLSLNGPIAERRIEAALEVSDGIVRSFHWIRVTKP
ncbi:MAG TPA: hypothetical protein PLO37_02865 [Candidatus Hydrogenedentes bacterium]|nr:hypothetical protein [Candidatus Hydrogenedentota bacterium]